MLTGAQQIAGGISNARQGADTLNANVQALATGVPLLINGISSSAQSYAAQGANVDADKIERVIAHFISLHNEPLFFILELPTNFKYETETAPGEVECIHKDIYYIDGCTQETALAILEKAAELLINDGMAEFGFGCHASKDEIMAGKYNVVDIYTHNKDLYDGFFETHGIERTEPLVTAWQTFSEEHYGECSRIDTDGKKRLRHPGNAQGPGHLLCRAA